MVDFGSKFHKWTSSVSLFSGSKDKSKINPSTVLDRPWGFQDGKGSRFPSSTLRCYGCQPYASATLPYKKYSLYSFLLEAGRIMSMKNSNYPFGNRTRPLPACSAMLPVPEVQINLLKPNDIYICRTAALTSRRYILNIYSTNIHTEYFKHAA